MPPAAFWPQRACTSESVVTGEVDRNEVAHGGPDGLQGIVTDTTIHDVQGLDVVELGRMRKE